MPYEVLTVFVNGDELVGHGLRKEGLLKLHSLHLYETFDEAQAEADELTESELLYDHWPMPDDPEVQEILADPNFGNVEYEDVEVLDEENSEFVYVENRQDELGNALVDWHNSKIVTKIERHPKRVEGLERINQAAAIVARRRAGLDQTA